MSQPCCWDLFCVTTCSRPVAGATISLLQNGNPFASCVTIASGCCMINIGESGVFTVTMTTGSLSVTKENQNLQCCSTINFIISSINICVTGWCGQIYTCEATVNIFDQSSNLIGTGITDATTGCVTIFFTESNTDLISSVQIISNFGTVLYNIIDFSCSNNRYTFSASPPNPNGGIITDANGGHPVCWDNGGGWACYAIEIGNICPDTGSTIAITYQIFCDSTNPGFWRVRRMFTITSIDGSLCYAGTEIANCSVQAFCCNCAALCLGINLPYIDVTYSGDGQSDPCDPTALFSIDGFSVDESCIAVGGAVLADPVGGGIVFSA